MPGISQFTTDVLENKTQASGVYELVLGPSVEMLAAKPGQFVEVAIGGTLDPFLRRPLSICHVDAEGGWSIVYRVQGRGTAHLARLTPGSTLDVLGPLGRGFALPACNAVGNVALVGGGVGVPPLVFLAQSLRQIGVTPVALCGFASADAAICVEHFNTLTVPMQIATNDGSLGHHGVVTELLAQLTGVTQVYACGPVGMLHAVADFCLQNHIHCQVSLEEKMACGVGACLSCVCRTRKPGEDNWHWQRVCKEGPVFDGAEVAFDAY